MEISGLDSELVQSLVLLFIVFQYSKSKTVGSEIYDAIHRIGRDAEMAAASAEKKQ